MGGLISHIRGMRKVDELRGRGEALVAVVETGSRRGKDEGHVRRYFGGIKGAAEMGIRKAWWG